MVLDIDPAHEESNRRSYCAHKGCRRSLPYMNPVSNTSNKATWPLPDSEYAQINRTGSTFRRQLRTSLLRIEDKIKASQFKTHMTEGISALNREDFNAARQAFEKARTLDPSSQAPVDGLSRLTLSLQRKQIGQTPTGCSLSGNPGTLA